MRLVPLTGEENRYRLLAIAAQDIGGDHRAIRQRELDEVARGTSRGVCAFEGTTPVGYAVYRRTVQTYHLDSIAVDRPRRRAGIGSALLEWICTDLKETGSTALNVVTDASAHAALRFYLDRGFALAGYVRDEFLLGVTQAHLMPASLTYTFGRMVGRPRQGWALLSVMLVLFVGGLLVCHVAEQRGSALAVHGVEHAASAGQAGGNMEGKEVRFGIGGSVLAAVTTSNGATGSYNSMHDSYTPVGGLVTMVNMLLGEVVFGGLGTGLYSLVLIALVGVFMAGLMIGRTPEYLGKQVTVTVMKLITVYAIIAPLTILPLAALALLIDAGLAGLTTNKGAHGLSEILVAYTTSMANNGQNFAGLSANTAFYNVTTALAMMAGRFGLAIPALALAGLFAQQTRKPQSEGTLPTDAPLFAVLTIATVLILGALSYVPVLALGPIVEHLALR